MTVTEAMLAQIRRMCGLSESDAIYDDDLLTSMIEVYPVTDANGEDSTYLDRSTMPPTVTDNDNWIPTYDLNSAAADIWEEKAATLQGNFDFAADGGNYKTSQPYENALRMANKYRSRGHAKSCNTHKSPKESDDYVIYRGFS